jgi:hypothetical protein
MSPTDIAQLIDESPMNRGAVGMDWLRVPGNVAFSDKAGNVLLFEKHSPHIYSFHWLRTISKPRQLVRFTRYAFREVYDLPEVGLIYGLVSDERRDAKMMARWIGAKSTGRVSTDYGLCEMFILTREDAAEE